MIDFQVVSAKTQLPVQSVSPIRGFQPLSIVVLGTNLNQATEVLFNGVVSPDFIVMSSTRLIVQIPDSQVGQAFKSLQVLGTSLLASSNAVKLELALSNPPSEIGGLSRLTQTWIMEFLTTPGTSVFSPNAGGGGKSLIGRNTDNKGHGISADFAAAITRTNTRITKAQSQYPTIPLTEKLLARTCSPSSSTLRTDCLLR